MHGIAALAAKEAAVVSGFGAGLLTPSAVDGFAVGTLLSAICVLIVLGPRRHMRRQRSASRGVASATAACTAAQSSQSAIAISDLLADELAETVVLSAMPLPATAAVLSAPPGRDDAGTAQDRKTSGHRSKHRMSEPGTSDRRRESRRSAPRHAAPSQGISTKMAGRLPLHPITVRATD